MSKELEKVISKLSQKSKAKVEPKPEPEEDEVDEDLKELTEGDAIEDDEKPTEKPVPKEEKPSEETIARLKEIETQVERLQNNGVYRVEKLYQLQRIGDFLEKLIEGDDAEEKDK